jgi:hypothetical protein
VKVGDFHGYTTQFVHLVQVFKGDSGYVVKRKTEAELGAKDMLLATELFFHRIGLDRS